MNRTTAQVATEAIVNNPEDYDLDTMRTVLDVARREEVGSLYVGMLEEAIQAQEVRRS